MIYFVGVINIILV